MTIFILLLTAMIEVIITAFALCSACAEMEHKYHDEHPYGPSHD